MSELPSTIKSRPSYPGLEPDVSAHTNLVSTSGDGVAAVLAMLGRAGAGFAGRTTVLLTGDTTAADRLRASGVHLELLAGVDELMGRLAALLRSATMGTRLYAAGDEGLLGRVVQTAVEHGVDHRSVLTEHAGTLARRVQCVHCKLTTEQVTVTVFECAGCGRLLFVRDHYSRRLAAFQGVCVNAEDPTERPVPEEDYR